MGVDASRSNCSNCYLAAVFTSGAFGFGAVVYDLILGFLAYREYQEFS